MAEQLDELNPEDFPDTKTVDWIVKKYIKPSHENLLFLMGEHNRLVQAFNKLIEKTKAPD